ncbi:MAG TPA: hypothetical protein VKD67_07100, partial [Acidimicrobiales bacterium]|nr:hypothetical protein [Acidimicrobiales bacterium]
GWVEIGCDDFDTLTQMLTVVQKARKDAGRDQLPFEVTSGLGRTPDDIRRAEELGVTRTVAGPGTGSTRITADVYRDWMKRFADEVVSAV